MTRHADPDRPWWGVVRRDDVPVGILVDFTAAGQVGLFYRNRHGGGNLVALESAAEAADVQVDSPPLDPFEPPLLFGLNRRDDPSKVSGLGLVAVGAVFRPVGTVGLAWIGQTTGYPTLTKLPSLDAVRCIRGHDSATEIVSIAAAMAGDSPTPLVLAGAGGR